MSPGVLFARLMITWDPRPCLHIPRHVASSTQPIAALSPEEILRRFRQLMESRNQRAGSGGPPAWNRHEEAQDFMLVSACTLYHVPCIRHFFELQHPKHATRDGKYSHKRPSTSVSREFLKTGHVKVEPLAG